jgi:CelD/BcsL family acetyltransferase involved in cellulose biosynthesis
MQLSSIDPALDPLWASLLTRYESNLFHSPAWIRALQQTYGLDIRALVLREQDGSPTAGVTYCRVEDMAGPRVVGMPFSDYCDPLVIDQRHWSLLSEQLLSSGEPVAMRCLYNELPLSDERFTLYNRAKWHSVQLEPAADRLWQRVDEASRRAIRKARGEGVVVRPAETREELREFFELHLKIRKYKYRLLAQPYGLFEQLWEQFVEPGSGFLMIAIYKQCIIGGIYFLGWNDTIYYKFNASDSAKLVYRPNDLLVWESMLYAKERGYRLLDFGLSDWDQEGLLRYKRKFATDERTICFLRSGSATPLSPQALEPRSLLPRLTSLFTEPSVPDPVTEQAGALLYRYFC